MIPKPEEKAEKPYKEDFFSNFETYHVCDDYAEDIINYLKERDVILTVDFSSFNRIFLDFIESPKLS